MARPTVDQGQLAESARSQRAIRAARDIETGTEPRSRGTAAAHGVVEGQVARTVERGRGRNEVTGRRDRLDEHRVGAGHASGSR